MLNIDELLNELTLEEKVCLLSGHKSWNSNKVLDVWLQVSSLWSSFRGQTLRRKQQCLSVCQVFNECYDDQRNSSGE